MYVLEQFKAECLTHLVRFHTEDWTIRTTVPRIHEGTLRPIWLRKRCVPRQIVERAESSGAGG